MTQAPTMVLTYDRKKLLQEKKNTVVWLAMFFGGFKLQPEKITTQKKNVQSSGQRLKSMFFGRFKLQPETIKTPQKKAQLSGRWLK